MMDDGAVHMCLCPLRPSEYRLVRGPSTRASFQVRQPKGT